MATTAREMNTLSDRLDDLIDRLTEEYKNELPQERIDAKGDATLLAALDLRKKDLETAKTIHVDAKAAFMKAKAAYKKDPAVLDTNYAEALALAVKLEAVLNHAADSDKSKTDTKADTAKDDGKDKKEKAAKDPADDKDDSKAKTDPKGKDEDDESDPVLKALKALTASCDKNHTDAMSAIQALEPRLIKPELAEVLNGLTKDQLVAIINRRDMSPQAAEIVGALASQYGTVEALKRDLDALHLMVTGGPLDRFRLVISRPGSHQ